jgi:hypothetical protein
MSVTSLSTVERQCAADGEVLTAGDVTVGRIPHPAHIQECGADLGNEALLLNVVGQAQGRF